MAVYGKVGGRTVLLHPDHTEEEYRRMSDIGRDGVVTSGDIEEILRMEGMDVATLKEAFAKANKEE